MVIFRIFSVLWSGAPDRPFLRTFSDYSLCSTGHFFFKKYCHLSIRFFFSCFFHITSLLCLEPSLLTFKFSYKRGYLWLAVAFALIEWPFLSHFKFPAIFRIWAVFWAAFLIEHLLCASTFAFGLFLKFQVQPQNSHFCLFTKGHFLNF